MESIGVIAEYNPFHNGHLYHLKKIKEKYKDSPIILIMTGNFTERGDVAIIDKWKRTEIPSTDYCPLKTKYTDLVSASMVMKLSLHKAITLEFYNMLY